MDMRNDAMKEREYVNTIMTTVFQNLECLLVLV